MNFHFVNSVFIFIKVHLHWKGKEEKEEEEEEERHIAKNCAATQRSQAGAEQDMFYDIRFLFAYCLPACKRSRWQHQAHQPRLQKIRLILSWREASKRKHLLLKLQWEHQALKVLFTRFVKRRIKSKARIETLEN